jgi:hypothetical protein
VKATIVTAIKQVSFLSSGEAESECEGSVGARIITEGLTFPLTPKGTGDTFGAQEGTPRLIGFNHCH